MILISTLIALSTLIQAATADAKPPSRLLEILSEREKIRTMEFKVRVHFATAPERLKLQGQDWEIHQWFDVNPARFRIDTSRSTGRHTPSPVRTRFAHDEKSAKLLLDVDSKQVPLAEFVKAKAPQGPARYEPRIIGLYVESFFRAHHYTLDHARRVVTDAVSFERGELVDGFVETYVSKNGLSTRLEFGRDGAPKRVLQSRTTPTRQIRCEMDLDYERPLRDRHAFPRRIEYLEYVNDALDFHETWELEVLQINEPMDGKVLTWEALAPKPGLPLVKDYDNQNINKVWNGKEFEPYVEPPPSANGVVKIAPDLVGEPRPIGFWLFAASTIVLSAVLIYRAKRRFSSQA